MIGALAAACFLLLTSAGFAAETVLTSSLSGMAEQAASREANLMTAVGVAAAGPRLSTADLPLIRREFLAARTTVPLVRLVVFSSQGKVLETLGARTDRPHRDFPGVVRRALLTGRTQTTTNSEAGVGDVVEAAIRLHAAPGDVVAEFEFSRARLEQNLDQARVQLYLVVGVAALLLYVAILPLLARAVDRLPPSLDPAYRALLREFTRALAEDELCVHFQPKVRLDDGQAVGAEALVRWQHPRRGLLGPGDFLPVIEASPALMGDLTVYVLERALAQCATWQRYGQTLSVAVNVSASVLLDGPFSATVRCALERHCVEPRLLTLEITEHVLAERRDGVARVLGELRGLGVAISIDDFGTGHSSLARLHALPIDELKIDRSFIAHVSEEPRELEITRLIIALADNLGLHTVAEGVEDAETLHLLSVLGCQLAQGYHLARPLPAEEFAAWLEDHVTVPALHP